jgi:hypothetical protein
MERRSSNSLGISRRYGRGGAIRTPDPLRPRELSRFQGVHRFSAIPNIYNNPGNLLSLKKQLRRFQQIEFGHSFGTDERQGRYRSSNCLSEQRGPKLMELAKEKKPMPTKRTTKRTTQTAATRPMTGADAFEAGRRAYEATAAGSTSVEVSRNSWSRTPGKMCDKVAGSRG